MQKNLEHANDTDLGREHLRRDRCCAALCTHITSLAQLWQRHDPCSNLGKLAFGKGGKLDPLSQWDLKSAQKAPYCVFPCVSFPNPPAQPVC